MINNYNKCDKTIKCCLTCAYWGGSRNFDGLGTYAYDMNNSDGTCNQVTWKGFGGSTVNAMAICPDYSPLHS